MYASYAASFVDYLLPRKRLSEFGDDVALFLGP